MREGEKSWAVFLLRTEQDMGYFCLKHLALQKQLKISKICLEGKL